MKKFLLSLIVMAFAGYASAQSFSFKHEGKAIEPGTYEIVGDVNPDTYDMAYELMVVNLTDSPITIQCNRSVLAQTPGITSSTCTNGSCFSAMQFSTPFDIPANSEGEFSSHFVPAYEGSELVEGSYADVQYSFYVNEGDEPAVFVFKFKYTSVSVEDFTDAKIFSNAYPNPAKDMVSFDYNMPADAQTASVAIYNMMGQEVIKQDLNINDSKLNMNVSDLTDGVYFYSLIINNQVIKTNKLVVTK